MTPASCRLRLLGSAVTLYGYFGESPSRSSLLQEATALLRSLTERLFAKLRIRGLTCARILPFAECLESPRSG